MAPAQGHGSSGARNNACTYISRAQHNFEPTSTLCTAHTAECSQKCAIHVRRTMRLLLLLVAASVHAVKEKATGFDFPKKNKLGRCLTTRGKLFPTGFPRMGAHLRNTPVCFSVGQRAPAMRTSLSLHFLRTCRHKIGVRSPSSVFYPCLK
mgnify:CR=1 FL=1